MILDFGHFTVLNQNLGGCRGLAFVGSLHLTLLLETLKTNLLC